MHDEACTLLHIRQHAVDAALLHGGNLCCLLHRGQCQRCHQHPRDHERERVRIEADADRRVHQQRRCNGSADNPHHEHHLLQQRLRRPQAVRRHKRADGHALRRPEDAGQHADRGQHHVVSPQAVHHDQQQHQHRADKIAGNQRPLQRPAIHKDAAHDAEQRNGQHVRDLHAGDLLRRGAQAKRQHGNHGEQCHKIAKGADDLRVPEMPHGADLQHGAHAHRVGRADRYFVLCPRPCAANLAHGFLCFHVGRSVAIAKCRSSADKSSHLSS